MIPSRLGRYEIRAELGRGGMATVYRAYDPQVGREVALKVLPREFLHDPTFRSRFQHEAQLVAALEQFPAIVPIYDFGEDNGQPYIVMRLLNYSLADLLAKGPLSPDEALRILSRLAPALDGAHSLNIVHRDLKPGNILFDQRNEPYISDFGIAKLTEGNQQFTSTGSVYGTPAYMSPEQVQGEVRLDGRSDIYALGIILFEMLTGQLPYQAATPMALALKHINDPIPRLLDVRPELPRGCHSVITQAMAKEREKRYPTAAAMVADLAEAVTKPARKSRRKSSPPAPPPTPTVPSTIIQTPVPPTDILDMALPPDASPPTIHPKAPAASPLLPFLIALAGLAILIVAAPYVRLPGGQPASSSGARTPLVPTVGGDPTIAVLPAGATMVAEEDGMVLRFVPAGEFSMGTDESTLPEEKPLHPVYLDAYWIDETEVTNAMFRRFVDALGGYTTYAESKGSAFYYNIETRLFEEAAGVDWQHPQGPGSSIEGRDEHPVLFVSYYDAQAYCAWAGRRLPTEAEWEKAARGTDLRLTPWGDAQLTGQHLNFADINLAVDWADFDEDDGYAFTAPVGNYPLGASPYGVLDLAGNVGEWVADAFDEGYYAVSPAANPTGPLGAASYGIRGSAWFSAGDLVGITHRWRATPGDFSATIGFRCARDAVQ